ncbi:MAG: hypothetical protein NC313_03635 [Butyrivibrio sp.]|nr:hypothetical protein [Butyrivibrio sp.]
MRIDSSSIGMESARRYSSVTARNVRSYYTGKTGSLAAENGNGFLGSFLGMEGEAENTEESDNAQNALNDITLHFRSLSNTGRVSSSHEELEARESIRQHCMKFLMYLLFGDRHRQTLDEIWGAGSGSSGFSSQGLSSRTFFGISNQSFHYEAESTSFSTNGVVRTADGREINFGLNLEMSRSFAEYYEENYGLEALNTTYTDPLVINLNANIAQLSDQKFFFDLDCDGEEEEISSLQAGSGFLALDLNNDGAINDGSELFGTKSGNGFGDLAVYDSDGDGWIDEDDDVWEKLLIWTKDENGKDKLYTLKEAGVGAICLQNSATEFALNSMSDNRSNGVIRNTGIFLYENGNVGTVQHLDLAQ